MLKLSFLGTFLGAGIFICEFFSKKTFLKNCTRLEVIILTKKKDLYTLFMKCSLRQENFCLDITIGYRRSPWERKKTKRKTRKNRVSLRNRVSPKKNAKAKAQKKQRRKIKRKTRKRKNSAFSRATGCTCCVALFFASPKVSSN